MILTKENYFSNEAHKEYLSVSQYKAFAGTYGIMPCEAKAMATINDQWKDEPNIAMKVGSFVDAHFTGDLALFKAQNPELFKKDGSLKAEFINAEEVIARIERDPYFMKYLQGEKQVIMTGTVFGAPWKIMVDCLDRSRFIADLKVMKSITDTFWVRDLGFLSFVEYWGYNSQAAIYQAVVEQNIGKKLPFYIAAASKEPYPNIEIIGFTQKDLDDTLSLMSINIPRIVALKAGREEPTRCGKCDFCRSTKVLSEPIHFSKL